MIRYQSGDEYFDRTFENALNGIPVEKLSKQDIMTHEKWVNDHWDALNSSLSSAAAAMGRIKSDRKATASRENGKKGGRPKKEVAK